MPIASDLSPSPAPQDLAPAPAFRNIYQSLKSWQIEAIDHGLSNASPVDMNIAENFPLDDLRAFVKAYARSETGSNLITLTCADLATYQAAAGDPERYNLVRVRMGGWTEFYSAIFPMLQAQHQRRQYFTPCSSPEPPPSHFIVGESMYQHSARHPLAASVPPLDADLFASMWELFVQIGVFWKNMDDPEPYRSQLWTFMENRIGLQPAYHDYYVLARHVMDGLIAERGKEAAYAYLFTHPRARAGVSDTAPDTALDLVRRHVSDEFICWQLALGGFKAWGARNYCGYIGGAYIPGEPVPYRTCQESK
jgi:hypothetical protein